MSRRGRGLAPALLAVVLASAGAGAAGEEAGAALWREGRLATGPVVARLAPDGPELRGAPVACARCHGEEGQGGGEGGVRAPPLIRRGRLLPGLDRAALARALGEGIGLDGRPLHPAMPRYALAPEALEALEALRGELERIARLSIEGVEPRRLRFATVWPRAAVAAELRPLLDRHRSLLEAEGGIVHRALEVVVLPVEPGAALRTLDELPALALLLDDAPPELLAVLRGRGLPELFPLRPQLAAEPPGARRLGAPRAVEARLLARAMAEDLGGAGRFALFAEPALERELAAVLGAWPDLRRAASGPLDAVLLLAPVPVGTLAAPRLYAPVDLLARLGAALPVTVEELVVSDPRALPPGSPPPSERARALHGETGSASPLLRHAAAALLMLETALRRLGRDVGRARLLAALDGLGPVTTGLVPPWSGRPGPESGAALVRLDRRTGTRRIEPWRSSGDPPPAPTRGAPPATRED